MLELFEKGRREEPAQMRYAKNKKEVVSCETTYFPSQLFKGCWCDRCRCIHGIGAPAASACWFGDKSDVTILYTNDVHTYIDKQSPKLTYAAIADLKQSYQNAGKDVLLVDAGDHVQGTAYGSMDEGASIIKLMNAAGYDVATPGNHEFDYGMDRAKAIMKEADFPYLSCNWVDCALRCVCCPPSRCSCAAADASPLWA